LRNNSNSNKILNNNNIRQYRQRIRKVMLGARWGKIPALRTRWVG
jgi:hypothetical protein